MAYSTVNRSSSVRYPSYANPKYPTVSLGAATIKAQQAYSDKFGISTFTTKGKISTVPTLSSGGFSNINVGIGSYSNFKQYADAAISKYISQEERNRAQGNGITVQDGFIVRSQPGSPIVVADPSQPTRTFEKGANNSIVETTSPGGFDTSTILGGLTNNAPLIVLGLVGLVIVMRLIKKI